MKHLTAYQRYKIEGMLRAHASKKDIALALGVSIQTVYNELRRGMCDYERNGFVRKRYLADYAQRDYDYRQTAKGRQLKLSNNWAFVHFIEDEILAGASPAVALARWERQHGRFVSLPTLYRYIYSGCFERLSIKHLPEKSTRKRSYHRVTKQPPIGVSIEERPPVVSQRKNFGHWEVDTVIGKKEGSKACLLVLTERLTRFEIIYKIPDRSNLSVYVALRKLYPIYRFKSLTCDNGVEFRNYERLQLLGGDRPLYPIYFCHPYTSCERGSNERMNRMIRRYFKKGCDFERISTKRVASVMELLNHYERRLLNWHTPQELFDLYSKAS